MKSVQLLIYLSLTLSVSIIYPIRVHSNTPIECVSQQSNFLLATIIVSIYGQKGQRWYYLEAAASASASASAVSDEANVAVTDTNDKIYNCEMLRDKNIKFTHPKTQRQHPYYVVAKKLSAICIKCYPDTGEGVACGRDGKIRNAMLYYVSNAVCTSILEQDVCRSSRRTD